MGRALFSILSVVGTGYLSYLLFNVLKPGAEYEKEIAPPGFTASRLEDRKRTEQLLAILENNTRRD